MKNKLMNGCFATSPLGEAFKEEFEAQTDTVRAQIDDWMEQGRLPSASEFKRVEGGYYDLCDSLRVTSYFRPLDKGEMALVQFCQKIAKRFKKVEVAPLP